jgi:hypothetical protein
LLLVLRRGGGSHVCYYDSVEVMLSSGVCLNSNVRCRDVCQDLYMHLHVILFTLADYDRKGSSYICIEGNMFRLVCICYKIIMQ